MAQAEVEQLWKTVCYTCPARVRTSEGSVCDESKIGQVKSNGSTKSRPFNCPNSNASNPFKEIYRNGGRNNI